MIEETRWLREVEEEIEKDKEKEKIGENGKHILRKRKLNRMYKYKIKEEKIEWRKIECIKKHENGKCKEERKIVKAGRRKKEVQKEKVNQVLKTEKSPNYGGNPQLVEKQLKDKNRESEEKIVRKKKVV